MNRKLIFAAAAFGLTVLALAAAGRPMALKPWALDKRSTSAWVPMNSGPGKANHVLAMAKNAGLYDETAAGATLTGIEGAFASDLTAVGWTKLSGVQGGGAPRLNIYFGEANGSGYNFRGIMFIRPTAADYSGMTALLTGASLASNTYTIVWNPITNGWDNGAPTASEKIKGAEIVCDEPGSYVLDDIVIGLNNVNTTIGGPGNSN